MKTRHASIAASALCAALTLFCIGGGGHVGAGRDHDPRA